MSTTVIYNGVLMKNVHTKRFLEEAARDDTDTDVLYHRFIIRVMGLIYANQAVTTVGVSPNVAPSATINQGTLRRMLLEDRKNFQMLVDDDMLLQANAVNPDGGSVQNPFFDVNNGPKPRFCEVTQIVGSSLYRVEYEIEIAIIDCTNNLNTQGVLNNRWSMHDSIDKDWYTTRIMRGRLRLANSNLNPHSFRAWCIPALQPNFKRENIDVVSSPDQLTLDYTIVDRQVFAAAPAPATTWSGTHIVSTGDGVNSVGEVNVSVTGPPKAAKGDLIDLCAQICTAKLQLLSVKNVLQQAAIIDHLEDNTVEMRVEVLLDPGENPYAIFPLPIGTLGQPLDPAQFPNYDPAISQPMPLYGQCTTAGLLVAALQSPCDNDHRVPQSSTLSSKGDKSGQSSGTATTIQIKELAEDEQVAEDYSSSDEEALYTHYKISSTYGSPQGILQLPLSASDLEGTTCAFIQICQPTCWRVVKIEAERYGAAPEFPPPAATQIGNIQVSVLDYKLAPEAPQLSADGVTKRYRTTAEYTYAFSRPPTTSEGLFAGSLPWMNSSIAADEFPADAYTAGIIA
jgi:hypothetical protein